MLSKNIKKNNFFLIFGFTIKKYKITSNIVIILYIIKFLNPYIIEINK